MTAHHDAHVRAYADIHDPGWHRAHVGAWVRHNARHLASRPLADGYLPAALHEYNDVAGLPLYWRIRLKHPDTGDKWIRPMRRTEGGGFDLKQPEFQNGAPLYRLPELAAKPDATVWIVEGETCADALAVLGLTATTSGGADSAGRAGWSILAGRAVTIWPDNDDAGGRYADTVAVALRGLGCMVAVLDVAALDLPAKGDCVDWLAAHPGATADEVTKLPRLTCPGGENDPPESTTSCDQDVAEVSHVEETDDARIARLAALHPLAYDRCRSVEAKALGVRPATLDSLVKVARADDEVANMPFTEVEPWAEPIDPAALLNDVAATVRRFIVLDTRQADAAALWAAFTWFVDAVDVAPLAIINAPERECGKSQLLAVFGKLVARPLPAANATAAFLFRAVELWEPTVLIDEADTFVRDNEELRGLVNAGHTHDAAFVGRVVGDNHEPRMFKVWGAKALAGIALEKHLPDATMSRAIVFRMRRKLKEETVERLRHAAPDTFEMLARKLARFADDYRSAVRAARPELPDVLGDRDQDNWSTLLSVAEQAGTEWVRRALAAALELSGASDSAQSSGNELLADIQAVFDAKRCERISTADLIAALVADDEAAWATWNKGRPLAPRQLSRMLKQYGIVSKNIRTGYEQAKGFDRDQFADAFARYLSPAPENIRPAVPNHANQLTTGVSVGRNENVGRIASVPSWDVGRINPSRDGNENASVPLEPAWIKEWDVGTDKTAISGGGAKAISEEDDMEFF